MNLPVYFILFLVYSVIGWIIEILYGLIENHKLINRGFLIGPYCPIYGCGCILIIVLLKSSANDTLGLFLKAIIICSLLEYITSYFMEKIFKARWWDYSERKFNINGRICLETMIPFGILACFVMYIVNPFFESLITSIDNQILNIIAIMLFILFLIDNIISFRVIFNIRKTITKVAKDNTEEITKIVKKKLSGSRIYKRIVKAFPKFQINIFKLRYNKEKSD